jgi:hypothetical protein
MPSLPKLASARAILANSLLLSAYCGMASAQAADKQAPASAHMPRAASEVRLQTRSDSDSILAVANRLVAALARDDTISLSRIAAPDASLPWNQPAGPISQLTFTKIARLKLSAFRHPIEMPGTAVAEFRITYRDYYPGTCAAHRRKDRLVLSLVPAGRSYHVLRFWMERC